MQGLGKDGTKIQELIRSKAGDAATTSFKKLLHFLLYFAFGDTFCSMKKLWEIDAVIRHLFLLAHLAILAGKFKL